MRLRLGRPAGIEVWLVGLTSSESLLAVKDLIDHALAGFEAFWFNVPATYPSATGR